MSAGTVAVTGANGFLGRAFVQLALAHGFRVVALVRSDAAKRTIAPDADTLIVDLAQPDAVARALRGCTAIVHAAGGGRMRTLDDVYRANLHTTDVLSAAIPSADTRFVFISSVAAVGAGAADPAQLPDASSAPRPVSHYGRSKEQAEQLVHQRCNGISLRLPALHGPGDDRLLPLFRAASRGVMPVVRPDLVSGLLSVHDAAALILNAVQSSAQGAYYADDGNPITRRAFCHEIGRAIQAPRPPRIVTVPDAVMWTAGCVNELVARVTGRPVLLTRDKVADLLHTTGHHDASRTRTDLDWAPGVPLLQSLEETANDFRRRGWLR